MGAAFVFLIASASLLLILSTNFVDAEDQNQIVVSLEAPPGSTIDETRRIAEQARRIIAENPEVQNVYTAIGSATAGQIGMSGTTTEVRKAQLIATLLPLEKGKRRSQQAIEKVLGKRLSEIPGARYSIGGNAAGQQVSIVLSGENPRTLAYSAQQVLAELRTLPNIGNITSTASLLRPEVIVQPDYSRAAELGVNTTAISQAVRVATTGDYEQYLPRMNLPNRQIYIRTQIPTGARGRLDTIRDLQVPGRSGPVPISSVAKISIEGGPAQIDRLDRNRDVTITIDTQNRPIGDINKQIESIASLKQLPPDVHRVTAGETEQQAELFNGFGLAIGAGVLCVYTALVLLFHDFLQPVTILTALPLSVGGAFAVLAAFGYSLSLSSLIGLIMLMGIVTKNSILLVEYAIKAREEYGLSRTEALIDACRKRARPIIMTTVAMVAGMLPMALQIGVSSAFRAPMALAVMGGLTTSTALSLLVVPVVFEVVDDFKAGLKRRFVGSGSTVKTGVGPAPAAFET